jgi:1,2-phenylacetyl-CoA epoxidase PaaB subunit
VPVWDVLGKRKPTDEFELVGGIKAPDVQMALVLARETHFRHKEGVAYAVRRRGEDELHVGSYAGDVLGGLTDHSYRRQEAYTGVGAKHKRVGKLLAERGLVIDRPRPPVGRGAPVPERASPASAEPQRPGDVSPEEIASQGTGG